MKNAFNTFSNSGEPAIQFFRVLNVLVGTFGRPNQVVGLIKDTGLPFQADKTFVCKDVTTG